MNARLFLRLGKGEGRKEVGPQITAKKEEDSLAFLSRIFFFFCRSDIE